MTTLDLEDVPCPSCGQRNVRITAWVNLSPVKVATSLVECRVCGLAYVSPRPTETTERAFYESAYFELEDEAHWRDKRLPFFKNALKKMERRISGRKLLDVGSGGGYFLDLARKSGWHVWGVEISFAASQKAQVEFKLDVFNGEIFSAPFSTGTFSAVTLWNVLDQMRNPSEQMKKIAGLMEPGGLLALRISNLSFHGSLHGFWNVLKKLRLVRKNVKEPTVFHLEMFSPRSVRSFLERREFERVEIYNALLDPCPRALSRMIGEMPAGFVAGLCYGLVELIRIISFGRWVLGPSLLVFARKNEFGDSHRDSHGDCHQPATSRDQRSRFE